MNDKVVNVIVQLYYYSRLQIWKLSDGSVIKEINHTEKITCLVCSRDSHHLVTGSMDRSVKVWELATGKIEQVLLEIERIVQNKIGAVRNRTGTVGNRTDTVGKWICTVGNRISFVGNGTFTVGKWAFTAGNRTDFVRN